MTRPLSPGDRALVLHRLDTIEMAMVELREMLAAADAAEEPDAAEPDQPCEPFARAEDFLEPAVIASRLGIGEQHVRKLCRRGHKLGHAGIERRGGRWAATLDAMERLRRV